MDAPLPGHGRINWPRDNRAPFRCRSTPKTFPAQLGKRSALLQTTSIRPPSSNLPARSSRPSTRRRLTRCFSIISSATNVAAPAVVRISNRTENPLKIASANGDTAAFHVSEVKTITDGKEYEISVSANPPFTHGTNVDLSLLNTGWSNYVIRIPAYLTVQQAITTQPHSITVPAQLDHSTTFKVTLYSTWPEDQFKRSKKLGRPNHCNL